ncbi:hypothetical protein D3C81_1068280 [compost metagenome]
MRRGLAHAKADLQDGRARAAEGGRPVERGGRIGHDEARAKVVDGALLPGGGAPGAPHERADAARMRNVFAGLARGV